MNPIRKTTKQVINLPFLPPSDALAQNCPHIKDQVPVGTFLTYWVDICIVFFATLLKIMIFAPTYVLNFVK